MNRRNLHCIARHNPRRFFPRVDDKLKTKLLADAAGISVPKLLGTVSTQHDILALEELLKPHAEFVLKPSRGSGGKGILVISESRNGNWVKPSGELVSPKSMARHASNILAGLHSLGGNPDTALFEALVRSAPVFDGYAYQGVPDIRVIVYRGFPIMAMTRLPTRMSDGKANLHQGAVGVGLDMATGEALRAIHRGEPIESHPETGRNLNDLCIPQWAELLRLAARCHELTELGYLGVDIVLDEALGPVILELNARPGLNIQLANGQGLLPRIERIDAVTAKPLRPSERARFSVENFAAR